MSHYGEDGIDGTIYGILNIISSSQKQKSLSPPLKQVSTQSTVTEIFKCSIISRNSQDPPKIDRNPQSKILFRIISAFIPNPESLKEKGNLKVWSQAGAGRQAVNSAGAQRFRGRGLTGKEKSMNRKANGTFYTSLTISNSQLPIS